MRARGARGGANTKFVFQNWYHVMRARAAARVREVNELLELEARRVSAAHLTQLRRTSEFYHTCY